MSPAPERTPLSPAEYRNKLLIERRKVVRTVRNTLLAIAIIAGLWWLYLISQNRRTYEPAPQPEQPAAESITESAGQSTAEPAEKPAEKPVQETAQ